MRYAWLGLFLCLLATHPQAAEPLPWKDGESLTYEIHFGVLVAAEGTFTAQWKKDQWNFKLNLKSRGIIETTFPIRSLFSSQVAMQPWRSMSFSEDRQEGDRKKKNLTTRDYLKRESTYQNLIEKETKVIPFKVDSVEDLGSSLYAVRLHPWEKEAEWRFTLQDRWKTKNGFARLVGKEMIPDKDGTLRETFRIEAFEVKDGKIQDKFWMKMWVTTDAERLPLLVRTKLNFGTFTIRLK